MLNTEVITRMLDRPAATDRTSASMSEKIIGQGRGVVDLVEIFLSSSLIILQNFVDVSLVK